MKTNIYIFRHGETDYNVQRRAQGYLDIPLNEKGIEQAHELADKLSNIKLDCIYTSPLSRAMETARIVATKNNVNIIPENGLQERNLGVLCGHIVHVTDAPKDTPFDLNADTLYVPIALLSDDDFVPDNGESYNMFKKRVCDAIMNIVKNTNAQNIGVATHGGVIGVLLREFTDFKTGNGGMPNAGYFTLQWDEKHNWLIKQATQGISY